jgi:hypothetical protein
MLQDFLIPAVRQLNLLDITFYLQAGASCHCVSNVRPIGLDQLLGHLVHLTQPNWTILYVVTIKHLRIQLNHVLWTNLKSGSQMQYNKALSNLKTF